MQVNDIVSINNYDMRGVGKITFMGKDSFGIPVIWVKTSDGKLYEVCEIDLTVLC